MKLRGGEVTGSKSLEGVRRPRSYPNLLHANSCNQPMGDTVAKPDGAVMGNPRADRIDDAVSSASELIGFLQDAGPINSAQARLIIEAAVRASVANVEQWEIRDSANRVFADLGVAS